MTETTRLRLAQVLAFVGLLAALVGALGPADDVRTTYSWPPPALPEGTPTRVWYTPLLLIRHRPESISVTVPCSLPPALPQAERPALVLASTRFPERAGGLRLTREGGRLVLRLGGEVLQRVSLPVRRGSDCAYRLRLGGGRWSLAGGPARLERGGALTAMPFVSGLFSALDLQAGTPPSVDITTAVHAADTRLHQALAWTLAAICALAALLLVALEGMPRPSSAVRHARTAVDGARPADAMVGAVLLGWWILSPAFADDGWVIARVRTFSSSGGFSAYFNSFGSNYPNDFWLEWALHWIVESSLLVLRVLPLLCLAAVWVLCRWVLARVLRASMGESRVVALWALATAFLTGALAWGMTLRPEPLTALFATAVLACIVRFLEKESTAPLAVSAVFIPLGLTGHHAAVVAFAPLVVVVAPTLLRWARARVAAASTIVASSIALLVVLLFVGSDLEQRRADARIAPLFQPDVTWSDELLRYLLLLHFPYGTPLRRASVALIALALLAFLFRSRRARQPLLDFPAASLGVAVLLLIATPTKHPWHFGALLGLAAVAIASETARLRDDGARSRGSLLRPLVAIGATLVAAAWCWYPRYAWNGVDLRTLDWTLGFESSLGLSTIAVALPLVLLAGAALTALARGRSDRVGEAPWRVAPWTAPLLALPLVALTVSVLAADAAKTDSWTLTRQNLSALSGDSGCGLADDLLVPVTGSARPLAVEGGADVRSVAAWVPPAPVEGLTRFALGPVREDSTARSPWFRLPARGRFGLFVSGMAGASDRLELEWGRLRGRRVESLETDEISTGFASEVGAILAWRFLVAGELPAPVRGANAVRVTLRSDLSPGAPVAITAPVTYTSEPLARRLERDDSRSLVLPSLVTFFPCARLPVLSDGVVEPPGEILVPRDSTSPLRFPGSPFAGVLDLSELERLSLADSENPPSDFVVLGVDRELPGGTHAAPTERPS